MEAALKAVLKSLAKLEKKPEVNVYLVGLTSNFKGRLAAYLRERFKDLILLTEDLTPEQALDLEEATWREVAAKLEEFPKAHEKMQRGQYRRGLGGIRQRTDGYAVYVAWA